MIDGAIELIYENGDTVTVHKDAVVEYVREISYENRVDTRDVSMSNMHSRYLRIKIDITDAPMITSNTGDDPIAILKTRNDIAIVRYLSEEIYPEWYGDGESGENQWSNAYQEPPYCTATSITLTIDAYRKVCIS